MYTCAEITDLLFRLGEDGVTDTAVEIIEKSDEKLTADILSRHQLNFLPVIP